jgi:hypothetical protein
VGILSRQSIAVGMIKDERKVILLNGQKGSKNDAGKKLISH